MATTSGTSPEVVSLPKGGGAVQGLGTIFETDLNTGTGSYGVPIDVPAGPNAVQPRLNLRYHSAAGNGPFGVGWTLAPMSIARRIEGRIPHYGPDDNAFTLVGIEDLLPIGGDLYRPRVDTLHWRFMRTAAGWQAVDLHGVVYHLGGTAASRVETVEHGLAKTAVWWLDATVDSNGHRVQYSYLSDGAQRYLERITWGTYELRFGYEARPDRLTNGRFGFLLETRLRCSQITLHVLNVPAPEPTLARSWTLEYAQAPESNLSLLHRVTLSGHDAQGGVLTAPSLTFGYSQPAPRTLERFQGSEPGVGPPSFDTSRIELLDWDGDGLPDLLELGAGRARTWPNLGRGRWGHPHSISRLPTPVALDEPGVALADMQGNGTADLIMLDRPLTGFYPLRPGGGFDNPVFWERGPGTRLVDRDARLVDLDGDGVTDLLVSNADFFTLWLRDGQGWSQEPITIPRGQAPPGSLSDPHVRLADMNGDGLIDYVRIDGARVTYWPYLGNGRWAPPVEMANPPVLPRQFAPDRMLLTDVDGDGCADLVYVDADRVLYWLNQCGVSHGEQREIRHTPPAEMSQIRVADAKGSGTTGLLWSYVQGARPGASYLYLDFCGGTKPYLLTQIDSGLGLETGIIYRSSTEFALDDRETGRPWTTFHPFPVQCVAEVRIRDVVTGQVTTTRQRYHEGRYDGDARTFLGFRIAETENVGDGALPTLVTRNLYHLGVDPDDLERPLHGDERLRVGALRRRLLRQEVYGSDGSAHQDRPFTIVHHTYETRLEPAEGGASIAVPFERVTLEEQWERGEVPFAFREVSYLDIDAHGNIGRQRQRAWRAGELHPDLDLTIETTFATNPAAHIMVLPARVTQRTASGELLGVTIAHYDGPAHVGLPEGEVSAGNITRREALAVPDALAQAIYGASQPDWLGLGYHRRDGEDGWWVRQVSYERLGSVAGGDQTLVTRGSRGFDTRLELDATGQFPARLIDAAGNIMQGTSNARVFQMATVTDVNGQTSTDIFDALGRVTGTIKPGDTEALPTSVYSYRTDVLPARVASFTRERHGETATSDEYQYLNGRGEFVQRIVEGEGDSGRRFIMQDAREYTARGHLRNRYLPYYVDSIEYAAPPPDGPGLRTRFDPLGRVAEQTYAAGGRIVQRYDARGIEVHDQADTAGSQPNPLLQRMDSLKRILAVEKQLPVGTIATRYGYDGMNRMIRADHPDGGTSRFVYDLLGRLILEESVDTGTTRFVVDAAGNQVQRTTAGGKTVRMSFDELDRLVEVREDGAVAPEMVYTYLDAGDPVPPDGQQNRRGRPWRIDDALGSITYRYDAVGRVIQQQRTVTALGGRQLTTDVVWDALGHEVQLTLPEPTPGAGRRILTYEYNARGLPVRSPGFVTSADYDVQGHLTRLVYQNGVENLVDFNPLTTRPARLRAVAPGGALLRDQQYAFDPVGNLLRIDAPQPVEGGQFVYDPLNRLLDATYGNGDHFAYTYSDGGNITSVAGLGMLSYGGATGSEAVTAAGGGAYGYDADGHLSTAPYGTLHFNALDNLTRIDLPGGAHLECVYDFQGRRAVRRSSSGTETIWADLHLEYHDGVPMQWITFGKKRIFALVNAGGVFLHADVQGTPTLYTDLTGHEVRRLAFGPYGTLRFDSAGSAVPDSLRDTARLSGQPFDVETGLLCLGRRFYDPRIGRFISADRAVPGVYTLDGWNRYTYARNNPLRYMDPSGRLSVGDVFAIIGIALVVAALIVAGVFTGGATWAVAGVVINVSAVMFATAVGVAAGAVIGGVAAGMAGGDVWKGVLLGGFLGGTAAFTGAILGPVAGGALGSAVTGGAAVQAGSAAAYLSLGVSGMIQGALAGAFTGMAAGFAGGKGNAQTVWTGVWKGAAIGAITGLLLGFASAYLQGIDNPTLRIGSLDKINPQVPAAGSAADKALFVDSAASLGQGAARTATGMGVGGIGTFVGVGSGPGISLLNIPIGWVAPAAMQYGGIMLASGFLVGMDAFNAIEFGEVLVFILEIIPFVGIFFQASDDANWGWFEDMRSGLNDAFDIGLPATT